MKSNLLLTTLLSVAAAAQAPQPLPAALPDLCSALPSLIHAKTFQLGPFSDAWDKAMRQAPASMTQAVPICARNLSDPDAQVRSYAMMLLHTIAMTPHGADALKPAYDQIARILRHDDDLALVGALLVASDLRQDAPDNFIASLERMLQSTSAPEIVRGSAGTALVRDRPSDPEVQRLIVNLMNDASQTRSLRIQLIQSCAVPAVGSLIIDNLVSIANTSHDKDFRDAAISAAAVIGRPTVARMQTTIMAILKDPTESDHSRLIASAAYQQLP